jgi:hypothetical protein
MDGYVRIKKNLIYADRSNHQSTEPGNSHRNRSWFDNRHRVFLGTQPLDNMGNHCSLPLLDLRHLLRHDSALEPLNNLRFHLFQIAKTNIAVGFKLGHYLNF